MTTAENTIYDLIIIGGGPAGLSAAIYAARYCMNFTVLAADFTNPLLAEHKIDNYPAVPKTTGGELWEKMRGQAVDLGANLMTDKVAAVREIEGGFEVETGGATYRAKNIILASGAQRNKPGLENEDKFLGHGLSYCSACDAPFYRGLRVAVVGGGNSALTAAAHLSEFASQVFLIHRGAELHGDPALREKIQANNKIEIILNTQVTALLGGDNLESVSLGVSGGGVGQGGAASSEARDLKLDGIFFEIGSTPETEFLTELNLNFNEQNKITVDRAQKTSLAGVWAAGDLTDGSNNLKQIITACAEGAIAAADVFTALKSKK